MYDPSSLLTHLIDITHVKRSTSGQSYQSVLYHEDDSFFGFGLYVGFGLYKIECPLDLNIPFLPYRRKNEGGTESLIYPLMMT